MLENCADHKIAGNIQYDKIYTMIMKVFSEVNVNAEMKCPFIGYSGIRNCDINATVAPLLPPIVPAGVFALLFHLKFKRFNETFQETTN